MKVIWSKESLKQFIEIEIFISKDNPERAIKFIDKLINRGEKIKDFPLKGRIVPEFSVNEIREVFENAFRIVYKVSSNQIEILTVFEGHKLLKISKLDLLQNKENVEILGVFHGAMEIDRDIKK